MRQAADTPIDKPVHCLHTRHSLSLHSCALTHGRNAACYVLNRMLHTFLDRNFDLYTEHNGIPSQSAPSSRR